MSGSLAILLTAGVLVLLAGSLFVFTAWTARRVERVVPPAGRFVELDGQRIHYLDEGRCDGKETVPILLIHGLGGQVLNFRHSLIGKLAVRHRVVAIDRPGSGHSERRRDADASISAQARTIAALIAALDLERPLVVGHSLGGAVALALALDHPRAVSGLALVAPLTAPREKVPEVLKSLAILSGFRRRLVAATIAVPLSILRSRQTLAVVFGPEPVPVDFGVAGGGLLSLRPKSFVTASRDLVALPESFPGYAERYEAIDCPIGIVFGTGDRILDPQIDGAAMAERLPGLVFETIEGGGHMIPVTRADRVGVFVETMAEKAARHRVASDGDGDRDDTGPMRPVRRAAG